MAAASVLSEHPLYPPRPQPAVITPQWIADMLQDGARWSEHKLRSLELGRLLDPEAVISDQEHDELQAALRLLKPADQHRMVQTAGELRLHHLWEKHRDTYEPHPAMTAELMKLKSDVKIPGQVLTRLPHINPMFLLPGAPELIHPDGPRGRIIAVTVTGVVSPRYPYRGTMRPASDSSQGLAVDTNDPEANAFRVMVNSTVLGDDDRVEDLDCIQFTMPTTGEFTLDGLVEQLVNDAFAWAPDVRLQDTTTDTRREYMTTCARAAVAHLLYACSRTVEMDTKPRSIRPPAARGKPKRPKSPRVRRLGWVTGAAIADAVRQVRTGAPGPGTGKSRRPHVRGAHLHLYRVGPGRQEIDIKWLDPIPVNAGKDDGRTITNHPMR